MTHAVQLNWVDERIAVLMFRDSERDNQICWAAADEIGEKLEQCHAAGARVVILASDLAGFWFNHAWLTDLLASLAGEQQTGSGVGWFKSQQALTHPETISIAAISGVAAGGGAELGWACDLRIAEAQATFSQPEVDMGITTGIGGCSRLSRLVGRSMATEMVLTGEPQTAQKLHDLGAINRVVPTGQALSCALELANALAAKSLDATRGLKQILNGAEEHFLSAALETEQAVFQSVAKTEGALKGMRERQANYDNQR